MTTQAQIFEFPLMIRESHVDTLGHMNNATYLEIFEDARWDLVSRNGFGLKDIHQKQMSPIILEIHIKFLKEVKARTNVIVKTQSVEFKGKVGKLRQTLEFAETGVVAADADVVYGIFDLKTRRLIPPPPDWFKEIGQEQT